MSIKDIFLKNNLNNIGGKENIVLLILFLFSFFLSLFIFLIISGFFNYDTKLVNVHFYPMVRSFFKMIDFT